MKNKLLLCLLFVSYLSLSQSQDLINYQGIARDANGTPITGVVSLKFDLRQGGPTAAAVFSELQTLTTNSLGLFSTRIGKEAGSNLGAVDFQAGSMYMEVSLSLSGGTYTSLGVQQLVSVPYALVAKTVPSSYNNNILTIGSNAYTLTPPVNTVYTASTGISITSGSIITNTLPNITPTIAISTTPAPGASVTSSGSSFSINVPEPTFTNSGQNIITGSYPNFTVNTPTVPAGITPTIVLTTTAAAGSSVSSSGSSFSLNVPAPSFTNSGPATITGTYPNYTINSVPGATYTNGSGIAITSGTIINTAPDITPTLAITTTAAAGASVVSSGSSFSLNVPPPVFTNSGPSTITGAYPNFTLTSATGATYTNGSGIAITSGSIINTLPDVPVTFTNSGPSTISGTYPNFTINSVPGSTYTNGSGIAITSGSIINTLPDVPVTFTNSGPSTISGTYPNFTINSVPGSTYTNGAGIAIVSGSIINTAPDQPVTFIPTGTNVAVSGTYPNFSVSYTPSATPNLTLSGVNNNSLTNGGSTVVLNTYTVGTGLNMTGGPNYTISSTASNPTIHASGVATVSPLTGTNFTVGVPGPSVTVTGTLLTLSQGTAVSTATLQSVTVTGSGAATVTPSGSNFQVAVAPVSINATGVSILQGAYPNYTVHTPAPQTPTIIGAGAAVVSPSTGLNYVVNVPQATVTAVSGIANISSAGTNSFDVNVPAPSYNAASGQLVSGTSSLNITPSLSFAGNVLTSGPASNSVTIPGATITSISPAGSASVTGAFPNYTISAPATPTIVGTGMALVNTVGANVTVDVPALSYTPATGQLGSGVNAVNITQALTLNGSTLTSGAASNSVNLAGLNPWLTSGSSVILTNTTNIVGIGTTAPAYKLDVLGTGGPRMRVFSQDGLFAGLLTKNNTREYFIGTQADYESANGTVSGFHIFDNTASAARMVIEASGNVGFGMTAPNAALAVDNKSVTSRNGLHLLNGRDEIGSGMPVWIEAITSGQTYGSNTYGRILRLNNSTQNRSYDMGIGTTGNFFISNLNNYTNPAITINTVGLVGISIGSPSANLHVVGTTRLEDGNQGLGKVLTSDALGNATWQAAANGWGLTGNAGTNPLTNYIGTSDNVTLQFRVNNINSGMIDHNKSSAYFGYESGLSITTGSLNAALGHLTLRNTTTGNRNSAFGYLALGNNTTGTSNTGIGSGALNSNLTGNDNTALGKDALYLNATGSSNVALGTGALLSHASGDHNVAIGRDALNGNTAGSTNIAIGNYAGYSNTGSGNVFIGNNSGYNETGSNKFNLANTATTLTPLMYGDFSTGRLGINTTTLDFYNFNIYDPGTASSLRMKNSSSSTLGFVIGQNQTNVSILNYENTPLYFGTAGANRMVITGSGDVGVGVMSPGYKFTVVGSSSTAAIFATNTNGGANAGEHGIYGLTAASNLSAGGVVGQTTGSGLGVSGIANNANGAGVKGVNQGAGAAVHAQSSVAAGSALALLVDDGHIATHQNSTPAITALPGLNLLGTVNIDALSTDVAGKVVISAGVAVVSSQFARITFSKSYGVAPVVIISATNGNAAGGEFYISNTTATYFDISTNAAALLLVGKTFTFNYYVIEAR